MNLNDLKNKRVCILGLGIENYALVKFIIANLKRIESEFGELDITVCDKRSAKELSDRYRELNKLAAIFQRKSASSPYKFVLRWKLGKGYDKGLEKYDIIFRSPGYPLHSSKIQKALTTPSPLLRGGTRGVFSPMKLFFELCPTNNIIGVTGTKGKGTTSALICHILKKSGRRVWLGGNIGVAPFEFLDKIKKNGWAILELSSFQLEDMETSPKIAVITNFTKEHLAPADPNNPNYHKNSRAYREAKFNILKHQKRGDKAVINYKLSVKLDKQIKGIAILTFSARNKKADSYFIDDNLLRIRNLTLDIRHSLPGEHNKENIAAAAVAAKLAGVKTKIIAEGVKSFKGLEHRIEFVKNIGGVKYYNDSFATTPQAAVTALKSFAESIILLAGGAEKNSDFRQLSREIKKRVKFLVLLDGRATRRLKKELLKIKYPAGKMKLVYNIREAVRLAKIQSINGDIVLLSPACASFGMFKNYKERGMLFKKEVKKL